MPFDINFDDYIQLEAPLATVDFSGLSAAMQKSKYYGMPQLKSVQPYRYNKTCLISGYQSANVTGFNFSGVATENNISLFTPVGQNRYFTDGIDVGAQLNAKRLLDDWYLLIEIGVIGEDFPNQNILEGETFFIGCPQTAPRANGNAQYMAKYGKLGSDSFDNHLATWLYIKNWTFYNKVSGATGGRTRLIPATQQRMTTDRNIFPAIPIVCNGIQQRWTDNNNPVDYTRNGYYSGFFTLTQRGFEFSNDNMNWSDTVHVPANGISRANVSALQYESMGYLGKWYVPYYNVATAGVPSVSIAANVGTYTHHSTLGDEVKLITTHPVGVNLRACDQDYRQQANDVPAYPKINDEYIYMLNSGSTIPSAQQILIYKDYDTLYQTLKDWGITRVTTDEVTAQYSEDAPPDDGYVPDDSLPSVGFDTNPTPNVPSYPDNTSDVIGQPPPNITGLSMCNAYALNYTQAQDFVEWLMTSDYTSNVSELFGDKISALNDLKIFPFDVVNHDNAHTLERNLTVANVDSGQEVHGIQAGYNAWIFGGSIDLLPYYGDYNDYTNAKYTLYVPFVGMVELDPSNVLNKRLSLWYAVDIVGGCCTAVIYSGEVIVATASGQMSQTVPLTYTNTNERQLNATLANWSAFKTTIGGLINVASKNVVGTINSVLDLAETATVPNLSASQMRVGHVGNIGSGTALVLPTTPFLIIDRVRIAVLDGYGSTAGKPSTQFTTIGAYEGTGFIQVSEAILNIGATQSELHEIRSLLAGGVFV